MDELLAVSAHLPKRLLGECELVALDELELHLVVARREKGRLAVKQLIDERADRPAVDRRTKFDLEARALPGVSEVGGELGSKVVERPADLSHSTRSAGSIRSAGSTRDAELSESTEKGQVQRELVLSTA